MSAQFGRVIPGIMAGPSPGMGPVVSASQNGALQNVLFYLPSHSQNNHFNEASCQNLHNNTVDNLSYMTSQNR